MKATIYENWSHGHISGDCPLCGRIVFTDHELIRPPPTQLNREQSLDVYLDTMDMFIGI